MFTQKDLEWVKQIVEEGRRNPDSSAYKILYEMMEVFNWNVSDQDVINQDLYKLLKEAGI